MMPSFHITSKRPQLEGWKYFWAKRVKAFRPDVHCARCLVGSYVKPFGVRAPVNAAIEITDVAAGDILYFCGVSDPYRWPRNMHVAARVSERSDVYLDQLMYTGDLLVFWGLERIVFDDVAARRDHGFRNKTYLTCRNFQFGAQAHADGLLPLETPVVA